MKLQIEDLNYSIDAIQILKGIRLSVPDGQFIGLVGPNGSGKTTLLRNIYRVLHPDSGDIFLEGKDLRKITYRESAKKMAVLRQQTDTEFDYSVKEIVSMGRFPHHRLLDPDTPEDDEIIKECLSRVGMLGKSGRMLSALSGGEKQRVYIARALAQKSEILILDEPTNHLDIFHKLQIMELVKKLNITVISAIHDLNLACRYCDYLYILHNGEVVAHGTPRKVMTPELLEKVFRVHAYVRSVPDSEQIQIEFISPAEDFQEFGRG